MIVFLYRTGAADPLRRLRPSPFFSRFSGPLTGSGRPLACRLRWHGRRDA